MSDECKFSKSWNFLDIFSLYSDIFRNIGSYLLTTSGDGGQTRHLSPYLIRDDSIRLTYWHVKILRLLLFTMVAVLVAFYGNNCGVSIIYQFIGALGQPGIISVESFGLRWTHVVLNIPLVICIGLYDVFAIRSMTGADDHRIAEIRRLKHVVLLKCCRRASYPH